MILHALPSVIMVQSFGASLIYAGARQWGPAVYWFAAGLLNLAVIYLIPGK